VYFFLPARYFTNRNKKLAPGEGELKDVSYEYNMPNLSYVHYGFCQLAKSLFKNPVI
jgi:hypothetical protein